MIKSLLTKGYRIIWRPFGRPLTYIMRQWSKQNRVLRGVLSTVSFVALAVLSVHAEVPPWVWFVLGTLWGLIWGHLFWDTKGAHIKHPEDFQFHEVGKQRPKGFSDYEARAKGDISTYDQDD